MTGMKTIEASWRVKTRPCPFYQQGRCVFEQSCNFVHDVSVPSSSSSRLPELLDALRDVLDPPDTIPPDSISLVSEHGASPHIAGEGWTLVNDCSATKESLLSPVSLPDLQLARFSTVKNNDSFDSGYASEWSSPQHLPSTLNLVASPFGSPPSRLSGSRLFSRSPFTPGFISPTTDRDESPDLDSPSDVRHSVATITAKDPDEDEDDEDDAQYSTAQWNNVPDDAALQRSTFSDSDSDEEEQQDDSTAHLAYLANDNDTINTLYDVYLHSPPQSTLPPVDQIRKRVFTPPPPQSGFSPRDSSTPPSTPPVSRRSSSRQGALTSVFSTSPETSPRQPFSPMSNGGKVPFGFRSEVLSSAFPETNSPQSTTSRPPSPPSSGGKVPFGFRSESRNGRRSLGPASASALHTAFSRTVTESPRRRRISRSVVPQSAAASRTSFFEPDVVPTATPTKGLKNLRLSKILAPPSSFAFSDHSDAISTHRRASTTSHSASPSISVPSLHSAPPIPTHTDTDQDNDTIRPRHDLNKSPQSAPLNRRVSWRDAAYNDDEEDDDQNVEPERAEDDPNYTIRRRLPPPPIHIPPTRDPPSPVRAASALGFTHPATPRPTLLFAIGSDDPEAVRRVLQAGEAHATDSAGPAGQSALQFTLANTQLSRRLEIARVLLAFGAHVGETEEEEIDPAMKYYLQRTGSEHAKRTSALIHRSFFRPLTRVRYELIGQDRALEQLFRVLSIHSQQLSTAPVTVLLCGPSGHGKSLLARKFGALLDVSTHTVNMTTLRSAHDLWQAYSMNPYEEPTNCTLAEFLINNEGKRCVVVLDEIEKVEEKTLWSLLMPWESGRCSFEANSRPIDVRNVVWLGTSNVGHQVVFEHHASRALPDALMSREEYVELINLVRVPVSNHMGASILSRVTTVLPFVPFTSSEQMAICAEAVHVLAGQMMSAFSPDTMDSIIRRSLLGYVPSEGARSLYRAVSNQLLDL